jgi:hypothetical protein
MKKWISRLFGRHESTHTGCEVQCVKRIVKDGVEVQVLAHSHPDGSWHYHVEVHYLFPDGQRGWMAFIKERDFGNALSALIDAERFIDAERMRFPELACTED